MSISITNFSWESQNNIEFVSISHFIMDVLDSASGSEISTLRGDISGQWSFSMRSTSTDLDVLPRVYLFLRGGNFTS